jgi:nitrogen fixation NifU-like protein
MYGEVIIDHYRHPRNQGSLDNPDIAHEELNPLCGDRVRIELALAPDGSVRAARFRGDLCMIAQAASSLLTELVTGASLDQIADLPQERLLDALQAEIRPARMNCALLPLTVLKTAVRGYRPTAAD